MPDPLPLCPRVLLADDDPDLLGLMAEAFAGHGWAVTTAIDGSAALRAVDGLDIDFAVIDMLMPGASGFRVLEAVKRQPRAKALMISGNGSADHQAYAAALGADGFLVKPFTVPELAAAVADLGGPSLQ